MRQLVRIGVLVVALASVAGALASTQSWTVVKRGQTAGAGQLALVGAIVRRPNRVAIRVVVSKPRTISLQIVMSCRRGIRTGIDRTRLTGRAPYTRALVLPLGGADNCAVSATGINPAGVLRLELLRSG